MKKLLFQHEKKETETISTESTKNLKYDTIFTVQFLGLSSAYLNKIKSEDHAFLATN